MKVGIMAVLAVAVTSYAVPSTRAALNQVSGSLLAGAVNSAQGTAGTSPTLPRGVVWVTDTSAAGGHWWVGDQLNGLCRLDPAANTVNNGPFVLSVCSAAAKSGGQVVSGPVPGDATARYLYVPDASSKSTKVVRYRINGINTASPTFGATLIMNVPNITQKGGGLAGGRPVAAVLVDAPGAPGQQDLLVGYVKSGDIMRVSGVNTTNSATPPVAQIGSTSDGIGVNSFAKVGNDLYVAEIGGLGGVARIADPLGAGGRPACTSASICTAVPTGLSVGFPGGLAYDGSRYLYVADTRTGGASNFVYRVDMTAPTLSTELVSNAVPAFSAKDSSQVQTTFTSYTFPLALGYRSNGDLLVGGDPQFLAAVVTNQQGHLWKITAPPAPPAVASIAPSSGSAGGGTAVTITGALFSTAPGATTVTFGTSPPVAAVCASTTSCTVTSPAGSAPVDVVVTVGGQSSATSAADIFTYLAPVGPSVTSVAPAFGDATGGTVVTVSGVNFATDGSTSIAFQTAAGSVPATSVSCSSAAQCTATSPAGVGLADVIVTTGAGVSSAVTGDQFAYTPVVTSVAPNTGNDGGGDVVTITGNGFAPGATVQFGTAAAGAVSCPSATTCTATSPGGAGVVDVAVTVGTRTGTLTAAFTYVAAPAGPHISSIAPSSGATAGGTVVTLTGTNFPTDGTATVAFGTVPASFVQCSSATTCTVDSPVASTAGVVNIVLTDPATAASNAAQYTYAQAKASFYAWGITAPKGGAVWLPGALGGHWWSSDHAQGFCRQDPLGNGQFALNYAVCGDDLVGSAGQGVYDPRPALGHANLHYVYVPDNAVRSVAVWRLTFDSNTETMVPDPLDGVTMATGMAPLSDVRTLKPNGMALGPLDSNGVFCGLAAAACTPTQTHVIGLYVTDLTDKYVRVVTSPDGDPRNQTIGLVAATGDGRGANGTAGFIGNNLYVSGNRATQFFDVTLCPPTFGVAPPPAPVCGMASVPSPTGVFVAGTATDPVRKLVYQSNSPGGAAASLLRYDASHDVYVPFADGAWNNPASGISVDLNGVVHCEAGGFNNNAGNGCAVGQKAGNLLDGGTLPGKVGDNVVVATGPPGVGAVRPWDTANRPTTATRFSFAFGLQVGPAGELIVTEDPSAGARSARGTMWQVPFTG